MIKSVYVHIPFCKSICSYCDFCKMFYNDKLVDNYLDALEREIATNYNGDVIETIYIGGGSPSCLSKEQLKRLFKILDQLKKSKNIEYTIEVNPNDINEDKIKLMVTNGINRVSIGIETINKINLNIINRSNEGIVNKIKLIKQYISNINVDLMYGFKNQDIEMLDEDINFILSLGITHISTYSLIIEEHTRLYIDNYQRLDDDSDYLLYNRIIERLKNAGFIHYEISNFSTYGYQSRHNLTYWHNEEYYGFGLGASGYVDSIRYTNCKNINKYINGTLNRSIEKLSIHDKKVYEMILGLRLIDGIDMHLYHNKYKCNIEDDFNIKKLLDDNYLLIEDNHLKVNPKYLYQENSILLNFID